MMAIGVVVRQNAIKEESHRFLTMSKKKSNRKKTFALIGEGRAKISPHLIDFILLLR